MKGQLGLKTQMMWFLGIMALSLVLGCSTHVGNPEEEESGGEIVKNRPRSESERVYFSLAQGSFEGGKSVLLYIDGLKLKSASTPAGEGEDAGDSGWVEITLDESKPIELIAQELDQIFDFAGSESIPFGKYSQLRLLLNSDKPAELILEDGTSHVMQVPSGSESGLKLNTEIEVSADGVTHMILAFDLNRSIIKTGSNQDADVVSDSQNPGKGNGNGNMNGKGNGRGNPNQGDNIAMIAPNVSLQAGNYLFKPVLRVVEEELTGEISGEAFDGVIVCVYQTIASADQSLDCPNAIATAKVKNGNYKLAFLPAGTYDLRVFDANGAYRDQISVKVEKKKGK